MCSTHGPNSQTGGPRCGGASRSASIEAVLPVKLSAEALGLGEGSGVSHLLRRMPFGVPIRQARFASRRARATSQIGSVDTNVATPRSWIQRATAEWRSRREAGLASRGGGIVVGRTTAPRLGGALSRRAQLPPATHHRRRWPLAAGVVSFAWGRTRTCPRSSPAAAAVGAFSWTQPLRCWCRWDSVTARGSEGTAARTSRGALPDLCEMAKSVGVARSRTRFRGSRVWRGRLEFGEP